MPPAEVVVVGVGHDGLVGHPGPCDDGTALAFDASLERPVEHLRPMVADAARALRTLRPGAPW